ncbi:Diphthamide biosynthesis protein 4 [Pseudocercospora fuligena]|uniref:Diphthamide biosynthesis protein 4 n=1 Tax=Pseudocercospora fuligena TaxID=685502 RepID=A0A8H6RL07_9PEZI|nr:Diphthamide biosynthesis protein 4 [Pseudocercospora fuligena]
MGSKLDYYEILGLAGRRQARHIPVDELRQAYKRTLLAQHPDKKGALLPKEKDGDTSIDDIAEAYRVLGDAKLKSEYDRQLSLRKVPGNDAEDTRHTGMETVDLGDVDFDEKSEHWIRSCRCGSEPAFVITEAELEKNIEYGELVTGCKGCSLWLKVLFSVEG